MTYNQFVNRPISMYRRIMHQRETVLRLENICMNTTMEITERVQSSRSNSQERKYVAYSDAKKRLAYMVEEYENACETVRDFLYSSLDESDADILEWKYIDNKSVSEIAEKRNLKPQTVKNIMGKADREARKKYKIDFGL